MKKVLALIIAAMMIVSMIPVMAITTSAAEVTGNWTTYRRPNTYEEPEEGEEAEPHTPASGYEYTDEGLHMISADYANCTPYTTLQTIDKVNIQDGVYMQLRIDDFSYGGVEEGGPNNGFGAEDNWIAFSIWTDEIASPGDTKYGQGWVGLTRHRAAIEIESFVSTDSAFTHKGNSAITPEVDADGKEIYTFEIAWDGSNYTVSICGVPVAGGTQVSDHLKALNGDGDFHIAVSFHSGVADGTCEATMLKFGTSAADATTPQGSDSKEPELNERVIADIVDSSTVPEGQPCLIFDANESSYSGKIATQGMSIQAQGDGSFKVMPTEATGFHQWGISATLSYEASDFPVIAFLVEDPNAVFESGALRYAAGKTLTANDTNMYTYSIWDDGNRYYGEDDEWTLVVIDMKTILTEGEEDDSLFLERWSGRINNIRFDYADLSLLNDPENDWFNFHWAGIFRTVEDAYAYADAYTADKDVEPSTDPVDTDPVDTDPVEPGDDTNPSGGEDVTVGGDETGATDVTGEAAGTTADSKADDDKKDEDKDEDEGGCGSTVLGSVAVLLSAAAAAVVLKKRD